MLKISSYLVVSQPYALDEESWVVIFATRTGTVFQLPTQVWRAIEAGRHHELNARTLDELVKAEVFVPADQNELSEILSRNRAGIAENRHLNYVIQPTAHCQLGCGYCGQKHSRTNLDTPNQAAIVADVAARLEAGAYRELNLCWFGAEPLSGLTQIRALTPHLRHAAEQAGCEYRASMITNGLALSKKVARELLDDLGLVSITVSLDGTAAFHDRRRHTKAGGPTFDRIFANLVQLAALARDRPIEIKLRCNVDRENAAGVVPLLHRLHEAGLHRAVQFYTAPIHAWGNDAHLRSLAPQDYADMEISWFVEMARLGFSVPLIPKVQHVVCLAVQPNAALVDAHGTLFACTEVSYVPSYGDPNPYAVGTLAEGETKGGRAILAGFNDRVEAGSFGCSTCRLLPVCGGACPKEWVEGRAPCPSSKRNMAERLLLAAAFERVPPRRTDRPALAPA